MWATTRMKHGDFLVFYQGFCAVEGLLNCFASENGAIESTCKSLGCIIKYLNLAMYTNHARESCVQKNLPNSTRISCTHKDNSLIWLRLLKQLFQTFAINRVQYTNLGRMLEGKEEGISSMFTMTGYVYYLRLIIQHFHELLSRRCVKTYISTYFITF